MAKTKIIAVNGLPREEWLKVRRRFIGGSDAAAVVGLNPYSSPYVLWADKTNRLPEKPDSEAMRIGRDLEQYVADRFTDLTGKRVKRSPFMWGNDKYPFAAVNIDREVIRENAFLECKTTSVLNLGKFKDGEFPTQYYAQVVHGLSITECDRAYLAVLVFGSGFMVYQLTRIEDDPVPEWCSGSVYVSDDEIAALMTAERDFWSLVETDTPPDLSGSQADFEALSAIYPNSRQNDEPVNLIGRGETIRRYQSLKARIKELETEADQCKQTLQADLGINEIGQDGEHIVTWKSQQRRTFDAKLFAAENPEVDLDPYYKISNYRKFDISTIS